jgi:hypothetical protein
MCDKTFLWTPCLPQVGVTKCHAHIDMDACQSGYIKSAVKVRQTPFWCLLCVEIASQIRRQTATSGRVGKVATLTLCVPHNGVTKCHVIEGWKACARVMTLKLARCRVDARSLPQMVSQATINSNWRICVTYRIVTPASHQTASHSFTC